jgi:Fe-Mn family superoxide dismutase
MFTVPNLPYKFDALEPVISKKIMELHHDKHHAAYVNMLNETTKGTEFENMDIEELLRNIKKVPENIRTKVQNHGGGHANHSLFWKIMRPPQENNAPTGNALSAINKSFGSFEKLAEEVNTAGKMRFGSGWSWLVKTPEGKLKVYSTANQDSPLMQNDTPIFGIDVWEHAYYLDYFSDRAMYLIKWWQVVNWDEVAKRLG